MQIVVLDTNALLMPFESQLNLDLELTRLLGNCQMYVPSSVLGELRRSKNKHSRAALTLSRKYPVVETDLLGDEGVIDVGRRMDAFVVTNDALLRSRLRKLGLKTIFLRSNNHLEIDGDY